MANVVKIRMYKGIKDWYYQGLSRNGKVVVAARGYNTKANAKRAAQKSFPGVEIVTGE